MPPSLISTDTTPIQVFARATGNLHWACPVCHYLHNATIINFRRPMVECDAKWWGLTMCNKKFRLGFLFENVWDHFPEYYRLPPFNALMAPPLEGFCTNRLGRSTLAGYSPAIAHVSGCLEYRCPSCDHWNRQRINFLGAVTCTSCDAAWRTSVLFHPPSPRTHRLRCPRDWSVTREVNLS